MYVTVVLERQYTNCIISVQIIIQTPLYCAWLLHAQRGLRTKWHVLTGNVLKENKVTGFQTGKNFRGLRTKWHVLAGNVLKENKVTGFQTGKNFKVGSVIDWSSEIFQTSRDDHAPSLNIPVSVIYFLECCFE